LHQKDETPELAASRNAHHAEEVRQWCHLQEEKEGLKKTNSHRAQPTEHMHVDPMQDLPFLFKTTKDLFRME
jgi:hypothetical protein